ncbi:MAG: hypothetical protein IKE62_04120 [Oscillospiraceae bacterium]|nr:hypothetical protein [Oscillospiraceae bacterium]
MNQKEADAFIQALNNGADVRFVFRETRFYIECWQEDGESFLSLSRYRIYHAEERLEQFWECSAPSPALCAEKFLSAGLWGGRSFREARDEFLFSDAGGAE